MNETTKIIIATTLGVFGLLCVGGYIKYNKKGVSLETNQNHLESKSKKESIPKYKSEYLSVIAGSKKYRKYVNTYRHSRRRAT